MTTTKKPPMPQAFITTSWDDGHPADLRLADMLSRHGVAGTFYVPRAIPTGVMSDTELRRIASGGFEIGAHTLNHVFLADTDDATAEAEVAGSKKWVEDVVGSACRMFCPPAGRYHPHHLPMFRRAGFAGIRSVEFMSLDLPRQRGDLLEMPTTLQAFPQPPLAYVKNAVKRSKWQNLARFVLHGRSRDWTVLAERLLARALKAGGVFHLWGHSWELEKTGQWDQLERVLRLMGAAVVRGEARCLTNGQVCSLEPESFAADVGQVRPSAEATAP